MTTADYQYRFAVPNAPREVFDAITRVREWWTINTDGHTTSVGDEFTVQFADVHRTTQRITVAEPGERIEWIVIESQLPWLQDIEEWKGTTLSFVIETTSDGTVLTFTHVGLTPAVECFAQCQKGWDYFIGSSLLALITTGSGLPDTTARSHMDTIGYVRPTVD